MGKNAIRRLLTQGSKWTDKTAKRHKHDFSVHTILRLRRNNGFQEFIEYFDVTKCKHCNSFKTNSKEGSSNGFISDDNYDRSLPLLKLKTNHMWLMDFKDLSLDTD